MRLLLLAFSVLTLSFGALTFSNQASHAAVTSVATANVNLRAGPSTAYPVIITVPVGSPVTTYNCVSGYSWCDVAYGAYRGWIAASYLQTVYHGRPAVITPAVATAVGLTVIAYNRAYWDRYYTAYPWYGRWTAYPAGAVTVTKRTVVGPRGNTYNGGVACGVRGCIGGVKGPGGGIVGVRRR